MSCSDFLFFVGILAVIPGSFQVFVSRMQILQHAKEEADDLPWNHAVAFSNYNVSHIISNSLP